jgi:hypothetical protein
VLCQPDQADDVDGERLLHIVVCEAADGPGAEPEAGVVDQDIRSGQADRETREQPCRLGLVADVKRQRDHLRVGELRRDVRGTAGVCNSLEDVGAPRKKHDVCAGLQRKIDVRSLISYSVCIDLGKQDGGGLSYASIPHDDYMGQRLSVPRQSHCLLQ